MIGKRSTPRSLPSRLLMAQGLVLVASIFTAGLVAAVVGPSLFHTHLLEAGHEPDGPELEHVEEAYRIASLISLGVALLIATTCALVVTWFLTSRLQRPFGALIGAARQMSAGNFAARVEVTNAGPELASLADAFNVMADRIEATEETRRRLLSDLAHELRTPIATIGAYVDGLEDDIIGWGPEAVGVLRDQTERLHCLAEDIDDVSRAEEGRLELFRAPEPANELVADAVRYQAASYAGSGVRLVADPGATQFLVSVDRNRFAQVLGNLLNNARRHTPSGGTVSVTALRNGEEVHFVVSDDGDGISHEQLPHLFERFYRGDHARDRERQGSGIGLTISKAIVHAHGGTLTASSGGPGLGSSFTIAIRAHHG